MKNLLIAILLTATTMTLSANPFDTMNSTRVSSSLQQNVKNGSKRLFFAQRAAKQGNPQAQFDLAMMYASGNGVTKDEKQAFYWFHKSARNNHVEAKYYMGLSFLQGRGVKKQPHLARYWFKQAVKAGHTKAVYHLSKLDKSINAKHA